MTIYVVTYEDMYGNHSLACAFTTKDEAMQHIKNNERFGCYYDYEEIKLVEWRKNE